MPVLEKICEEIDGDPRAAHRDFRLWLTSYPSDAFPVSILQNGIKMTREAKKGLMQNLQDTYAVDPISDPSWFGTSSDPRKFRKLVFGLAFFHAVIQERRLYGPLGWNIRYEFNETDLRISVRQLKIYLDQYPDKTPFDALRYLTAECNYGGRVTDANDRILIEILLQDYFTERIFQEEYRFSPSGLYYAPAHGEQESYIEYAKTLPLYPDPEVFGFHDNAAITKNLGETNALLDSLMRTSGEAGGGADDDKEAMIVTLANTIIAEVPECFDMEYARQHYDTDYMQSMNSVLTQELEKFNRLITLIKSSLKELKKAIAGEALLSPSLEAALSSMAVNAIPDLWKGKSFNSLKPLGSYIKDVQSRIEFFKDWLDNGIPRVFWINKFFFAHGFLTGARQNYARKYQIPIDLMDLDYKV
jgi:dynein heavy chain